MNVSATRSFLLTVLALGACALGTVAAVAADADLPSYKPPPRGAPSGRLGMGTRGIVPPPHVWALAPGHVGLTTREQPSLYWYADRPAAARVELVAVDAQGEKTLLNERVNAPASPRIMRIDLARYGIRLQPGTEYRWTVTLEGDPVQRSHSAGIERVAAGDDLSGQLARIPRARHAMAYAEAGIWYDAIAALGELIEQAPNDASLRMQRAALLQQVGLKEAAAADVQR